MTFLNRFIPYQLWRYAVLNIKILRGVDRSTELQNDTFAADAD